MSTTLATRLSQAFPHFFRRDPLTTLQEELGGLLNCFQTDWNGNGQTAAISPAVDLSKTDDAIKIRMDMPGIKAEEIDVEVSGNMIRIRGEHKEEKEENDKTFHRLEQRSDSFSRTLALPVAVNESQVKPEYQDGILTVNLPKTKVNKAQKIEELPK